MERQRVGLAGCVAFAVCFGHGCSSNNTLEPVRDAAGHGGERAGGGSTAGASGMGVAGAGEAGSTAGAEGSQQGDAGSGGNAGSGGATGGSSTNSGGTAGQAMRDAGPSERSDAGTARDSGTPTVACAGSTHLACDDFESAALDTQLWRVEIIGQSGAANKVAVETTRAHGGTRSVHVHAANHRDDGGHLVLQKPLASLGNVIYGRAFIYLASPAPVRHISLVEATGPLGGGTAAYRYGIETQRLMANYYTGARDEAIPTNRFFDRPGQQVPYSPPLDRWACMEWLYNGPQNEMRFWIDGGEIVELHRKPGDQPVWTAPPFNKLWLGWQMYGDDATPSFDLWIDDVAVDKTRVGCGS